MAKVRKRLIREKAVIAIYQQLLMSLSDEERHIALNSDEDLNKNKEDLKYCIKMTDDIVDHFDEIKDIIAKHLRKDWSIDRIAILELAILMVGTYELCIQGNDKNIVINEAVELSKKYCDDNSYKFINGVLTNEL